MNNQRIPLLSRDRAGFTLLELLVVIAIIALLITVSMAFYGSAKQKSRDGKRAADIRQVQGALQLYYDSNTMYPSTLADLIPLYLPSSNAYTDPSGGEYLYNAYENSSWYTAVPVWPAEASGADSCGKAANQISCQGYNLAAQFELGNEIAASSMTGVANPHSASVIKAIATASTPADCDGSSNPARFCYAWRQN